MNIRNLATGEEITLSLTENADDFFSAILGLSNDGSNLVFSLGTDEVDLFESRFDGEHVSVFMHELRSRADADDSLTYRENAGEPGFVFTIYRKPD